MFERDVEVFTTELSNGHLIHRSNDLGSQFTGEIRRGENLRVVLRYPSPQA
ncbi:MAG TPA: hypothetical protein VF026_15250 [Ktedonobacteraceae bacterium]